MSEGGQRVCGEGQFTDPRARVQCGSPRVTGDKLLVSAVVHGLSKLGQERPACYSGPGTMKCQVQILSLLWPHRLPHVGVSVNCALLQSLRRH